MPEQLVLNVDDADGLPPELVGKTPKEIAAYYSRREEILIENARRSQPAPAPAPAKTQADDKIDLFNDPDGSIRRVVNREVTEQVDRVSAAAQPAIVNACRISMRDKYKDYDRFGPEIEKRMTGMNPESQMNPEYWDYTYKIVKGENTDRLVAEAETRARNPVEKSTPASPDPAKPRQLTSEEKDVARKFGISEDNYRDAAKRYEDEDGRLPLTTDSMQPKQKRKAS